VINAGVPGYTSHQGLVYLRKHRLELHPSIVVAGFGFNDATRDGSITERIASERRVMPFLRTDDFLLYRSYFWRWARSRWHVQRAPDLAPRAEVPIYSKNLAEIVDLVRGRQGKTLLLDFLRTTDNYSKAMHAVAQTEAVPVLVYQGPHADIVHPTPDGYRTLATQVLDRLVAERWVPAVGDRSGGDLSHAVSEKAKTVLASLRPAVTSGLDPQPIRTVAENGGGGGGVGPRQLAEIVRFHRLSEGPRQG
jgi:lysophospholipase L1-like esterase